MLKDEIVSSTIKIVSPSISSTLSDSKDEFMAKRFYIMSVSHNSAVIIGSTLAMQQKSIENEQVLDAAAMTFVKDETNINVGIRQATADGLGGSLEDEGENDHLAKTTSSACKSFIESDEPASLIYKKIAENSKAGQSFQEYDSHCAMATALFSYQGKGKYQGKLANMGDTLLLVLSPDLRVKKQIAAQHIYRGFNSWSPASVQMLIEDRYKKFLVDEFYEAKEGDFIIAMTDGVWSELPLQPMKTPGEELREFSIDETALGNILKNSKLKAHFSTHELALSLLSYASLVSLKKRHQLLRLVNELKQLVVSNQTTVEQVLELLIKQDKQETATLLETILFNEEGGDGVVYLKNVEIPFWFVLEDLQKRTVGDCSTLNVTRLPYYLDECIRALVKEPENVATIMPKLLLEVSSVTTIKQAIRRLLQENVLSNSQSLVGQMVFGKSFDDQILTEIETLLIAVYQIKKIMNLAVAYQDKLNWVSEVFDNFPNKQLQRTVFKLVEYDLKPGFSVYSLFFLSSEQETYNSLAKLYGPGLPLSTLINDIKEEELPRCSLI
ncbi:MAG: hypothetical protein H0U73_10635 [Tatlockia sp.]|nr:hypothetical protein [Tatlockia sp.]